MQTSRHVYLIGFMGCGKSFWGKELAQALDLPFFDLDELISELVGKSIPRIFQESGEAGFRLLETRALHLIKDMDQSAIIATGGGTPCFSNHLELMKQNGLVIYLQTEPKLLATRLKQEKENRPLLANVPDEQLETVIRQKLEQRMECYHQADKVLEQHSNHQDMLAELLPICKHWLQDV
ncbi:MAG: shikimate kinase [Saprospiraceae bacterium]|nr:shikimate kinase [Saprospiraceae bacterium]